jgi:hypothetical protein
MTKFTYVEAFEIAKCVRRHSPKIFRDGVERAAALAAIEVDKENELAEAIEREFNRYEVLCPRWDGSIA